MKLDLTEMSLFEKEDILKITYPKYKSEIFDMLYDRVPELMEEFMDEIIDQEELISIDEHESLTNEERNK